MKAVKFRVQEGPYVAGETAGFPDDVADRLVSAGRAIPIDPKVTEQVLASQRAAAEESAREAARNREALFMHATATATASAPQTARR